MITEEQAREAVRRLLLIRDHEGDDHEQIARDAYGCSAEEAIPKGHRDLVCVVEWCGDEFARRDAERAELDQPIDAEWLESLPDWRRTGDYVSTRIKGNDVWWHIGDECIGFGGLRQGHITTRRQLLRLIEALKGGGA